MTTGTIESLELLRRLEDIGFTIGTMAKGRYSITVVHWPTRWTSKEIIVTGNLDDAAAACVTTALKYLESLKNVVSSS